MTVETNSDGLTRRYGNPEQRQAGGKPTMGVRKELVYVVNYDDLPGPEAGTAFSDAQPLIPAGSVIESAKLVVGTAFAGGTSLTIGTFEKDGSTIDADGIDAAIATAALTAGAVIACDGALAADAVASASLNSYVKATTAGSFTAGKAKLVITYIDAGLI